MRLTANQRSIFLKIWERFIDEPMPGHPDTVHGSHKVLKHQWQCSEENIEDLIIAMQQRTVSCEIVSTGVSVDSPDILTEIPHVDHENLDVYRQCLDDRGITGTEKYIASRVRNIWHPESPCIDTNDQIYYVYNEEIQDAVREFEIDEIFHPKGPRSPMGVLFLMRKNHIILSFEHTSTGYVDDAYTKYLIRL